jgi:hypothetical protein
MNQNEDKARTGTNACKIKSVNDICVLRTLFLFPARFGTFNGRCCLKYRILRLRAGWGQSWASSYHTARVLDADKDMGESRTHPEVRLRPTFLRVVSLKVTVSRTGSTMLSRGAVAVGMLRIDFGGTCNESEKGSEVEEVEELCLWVCDAL